MFSNRKSSTSQSTSRANSRAGSRDSSPVRMPRGVANSVGDPRARHNCKLDLFQAAFTCYRLLLARVKACKKE